MENQKGKAVDENKKKRESRPTDRKKTGRVLIIIAILIVLFLPLIIYPYFYAQSFDQSDYVMDTTDYLFRSSLNAARYLMLAGFSFYIGTKYLFEDTKYLSPASKNKGEDNE